MTGRRRTVRTALLFCALVAPSVAAGQTARPSGVRAEYQPVRMMAVPPAENASESPMHIAIVGSVASPATYILEGSATAADALAAAGGLLGDASDNLIVVRQGRILGPVLFDPLDKSLASVGRVLDGDVLVFRPRRGVRTAHFRAIEGEGRPAAGVENAAVERPVHVACVGLAEYPVVLPLPASRASERVLLLELLGLDAVSAERDVRRIADGAFGSDAGALHDGAVLHFAAAIAHSGRLRPVEPFPLPRDARDTAGESAADAATDMAAIFTPPAPQRPAGSRSLLTEPLPGFPFLVRDDSSAPAALPAFNAGTGAAPPPAGTFRAAEVSRGAQPVDVTPASPAQQPPTVPSRSLLTSADYQTEVRSTAAEAPAGIRVPPAIPAPASARPIAALEGTPAPSSPPASGRSALERPVDLSLIGAVLAAALACLAASYIWAREERRRVAGTSPAVVPAAPPASAGVALADLLENALPVLEEPAQIDQPRRLFGPLVGQKRLMIDAPHGQVAAPHFAVAPPPNELRQKRRMERVLSVAAGRRGSTVSDTSGAAMDAAGFRYDVVEPESPRRSAPAAERSAPPGELLSRVLGTLHGEKER
jgi:hypothetical protein